MESRIDNKSDEVKDYDNDTLQTMHETIISMFRSSCELIVNKDIDKLDFNLAYDLIQHTLTYLRAKRDEINEQ